MRRLIGIFGLRTCPEVQFFTLRHVVSRYLSHVIRKCHSSRKHACIILTPLNPTFFYSKTGVYRGIHYFSYFCSKHRLWVLVRNRLTEAVLTRTHNLCFEQKHEKYQNFLSKNYHFLVVKFSVYLNRHVFVMNAYVDNRDPNQPAQWCSQMMVFESLYI